ncbi:hypothetical protein SAMN05216276_100871 [Streptosporangium subroseum]|uniref:Lipoprotein n=1 Tax=Streptosporangium subroseum TaxID=106412 RepID=A0A239DWQ7_9ACTN|nr:hypothetical protein [Streptosporangium subroseum]SNS36054.1 hypothetical protein SAMN05216276_100871 [Streptosporangium subroseum]
MPYFTHRFPVRLGMALLLTAMTLTACGGGEKKPTAAEAGTTLKTHILELLKEVNAQNIKIIDSGGKKIPCGEEKIKYTFAATGQDTAPQTKPTALNAQLLGALNEFADYKMTNPESTALRAVNESTRTSIEFGSNKNGQYVVRGETECLSQS